MDCSCVGVCNCSMPTHTTTADGLVITINPEARVSVMMAGSRAFAAADARLELPVTIVNEGKVTMPLAPMLVGMPSASVRGLESRLSGASLEYRTVEIVFDPASAAPVSDVTLAFTLEGAHADLGGRDRVHFLVRSDRVHMRDSHRRED
jgi:hypothetical protein